MSVWTAKNPLCVLLDYFFPFLMESVYGTDEMLQGYKLPLCNILPLHLEINIIHPLD